MGIGEIKDYHMGIGELQMSYVRCNAYGEEVSSWDRNITDDDLAGEKKVASQQQIDEPCASLPIPNGP